MNYEVTFNDTPVLGVLAATNTKLRFSFMNSRRKTNLRNPWQGNVQDQ